MSRPDIRTLAAAAFLAVCVILGGASAGGHAANLIVQILAALFIPLALWRRDYRLQPEARPLIWLAVAFGIAVMVQLVPLPAGLWQSLPGREPTQRALALLGLEESPLPISLAPGRSLWSVLSLLPAAAMFLLVARLPVEGRRNLMWVLLALVALSIFLGAMQLLGGIRSPLRFYAVTNPDLPVGFFANANHQATLILCALPIAGLVAARATTRAQDRYKRRGGQGMAMALGVFLTVGILIVGSLAGYGLFVPAAVATFLIYRRASKGLDRLWLGLFGAATFAFAAFALLGPISSQGLSSKFDRDHPTSRGTIASVTTDMIADFQPVGSGLGTFSELYRTYEREPTPGVFVNHAHNDYLEFALELGLVGILLMAGFLWWVFARVLAAWRYDGRGGEIMRAASVMTMVVILHSIVDYPLRTTAIAAVMALACAMMLTPPIDKPKPSTRRSARHLAIEE